MVNSILSFFLANYVKNCEVKGRWKNIYRIIKLYLVEFTNLGFKYLEFFSLCMYFILYPLYILTLGFETYAVI